jgi:hypothetical protein
VRNTAACSSAATNQATAGTEKNLWIFSQGEYTENAGNNHLKEEYFLFFAALLGLFSVRLEQPPITRPQSSPANFNP